MFFALHLVKNGFVSPVAFVEALDRDLCSRPPIGQLALKERQLSLHEVFEILGQQATDPKPFGRIAVEMGLLDEASLGTLLLHQADHKPDLLDHLVEMGAIEREILEAERVVFFQSAAEQREATLLHVVVQ